ncbi:hypothetical protein VP01_1773g2 [Puccinia sorghi]|uniref:Uncharacterized protein n=1 Tax=Puccinia sorghi TaxID=27349 RepID=A0A0L6VGK6_9BASI|nr:hypothetical protein VP01_1773g2 [Puccinia sorghi]
MGRAAFPALGLRTESSKPVDQIQRTQNHNDFANAWEESKPSPAHPQAQTQYPRGTRQTWPSVLILPEDLFEASIPLKNHYDRTPWDSPYWPESKASLPRTVETANEAKITSVSEEAGQSSQASPRTESKSSKFAPIFREGKSSHRNEGETLRNGEISHPPNQSASAYQSLLSEDFQNPEESHLPSQKPRGPIQESFQKSETDKSPVISEEIDQIHPEETSEETSSPRPKTKSTKNETEKGSRENQPDPKIAESEVVQEGPSSSGSNTGSPLAPYIKADLKTDKGKHSEVKEEPIARAQLPLSSSSSSQTEPSPVNPSKKKEHRYIKGKKLGGKVAPLTPEQLSALEKKGKWKVLYGSAEKGNKPTQGKEPYLIGNETQAVSEKFNSAESFPMCHSAAPLPPNTAHQQQEQGIEKTYKKTLNKIELDEISQTENDSSSPKGKGFAFVTNKEGETIQPSEENNIESKIGISSESSVRGPTAEDIYILSLIDQETKSTPETQRIISTAPMRFKIDYDSQENYLYSEYQKAKESFKSKTPNRPLPSIMAPFMIDPQIKKKIERKIELVCKDMIVVNPSSVPFECRSLNHYCEVTVQKFFELWGQGYVLSWEANRLNIKLMSQLAIILNLHNDSPHFGISPIFNKVDIIARLALLKRQQLSIVIGLIYDKLGKEEGTRRLEAFTKFLMYHSIAKKWKALKRGWKNHGKKSSIQAEFFEMINGISEDPQFIVEIPEPLGLWSLIGSEIGPQSTWPATEMIYGILGARNHLNILDHTEGMLPDINKWWKSTGLESASRKFGLDILRILKVGKALQFGSEHFVLNFGNRGTSAEKAFSTILDVMNEPRSLPWIESPERAWLHSAVGSLYQDRLRNLSLHVFFKGFSSQPNMELTRGTRSGFELIWCDLGLNLMEVPNISDLQDPGKFQKKLKQYQNISGCFLKYSRMAISIWFRFFYANTQIHLSKTEERSKKQQEFLQL